MVFSSAMRIFTLAALAVFLPSSYAAETVTLRVSPATAAPGSVASVDLVVADASHVGAMDLAIRFDPAVIRFREIVGGTAAEGALIEANEISPGHLLVALANGQGLAAEGRLCALRFDVEGVKGDRSAVSIEAANAYHHEKLIDLPLSITDGEVLVTAELALFAISIGVAAVVVVAVVVLVWRSRRVRKAA